MSLPSNPTTPSQLRNSATSGEPFTACAQTAAQTHLFIAKGHATIILNPEALIKNNNSH